MVKNTEIMNIEYWVVNSLIFAVPFTVLVIREMYKDIKKQSKLLKVTENILKQEKRNKNWLDEVPEETVKVMLKSLAEHHHHLIDEKDYFLSVGGEIHGTVNTGSDLWRETLKMYAKYAHGINKQY